jgi:hypothetical protein
LTPRKREKPVPLGTVVVSTVKVIFARQLFQLENKKSVNTLHRFHFSLATNKSSDDSSADIAADPATTMSYETTLDLDDSSTRNGGSTTGTSRDQLQHHHQYDDDIIAKKETQLVIQQRLFVGSLLLVAGVAISLVVYLTTSRSEHREFRAFFNGGADKILSTFNDIVREKVSWVLLLCVYVCVFSHGNWDSC